MTNQTGFWSGMGSFRRRKTSVSIHRLMSGRSASRMVGRDVMKIQPRRVSAQLVAVQAERCLVWLGQKPEAVRAHIERTENACPLLRGLRIDQHPILGSFDATVDFGRIGHPLHQFLRRRKDRSADARISSAELQRRSDSSRLPAGRATRPVPWLRPCGVVPSTGSNRASGHRAD